MEGSSLLNSNFTLMQVSWNYHVWVRQLAIDEKLPKQDRNAWEEIHTTKLLQTCFQFIIYANIRDRKLQPSVDKINFWSNSLFPVARLHLPVTPNLTFSHVYLLSCELTFLKKLFYICCCKKSNKNLVFTTTTAWEGGRGKYLGVLFKFRVTVWPCTLGLSKSFALLSFQNKQMTLMNCCYHQECHVFQKKRFCSTVASTVVFKPDWTNKLSGMTPTHMSLF